MKETPRPRVSIGLPVYNGERYLPAALDSLLAQTWRDFELVISDNASEDRTSDICREYAARDSRIRYYRESVNRGSTWNFNRVYELSVAPYFTWAAHDDVRMPENIARGVEILNASPDVVLAYTQGFFIDSDGALVRDFWATPELTAESAYERLRHWFHTDHVPYRAMFGLMRRSALELAMPLPNTTEDDDVLLTELLLLGPWRETPELLLAVRDHETRGSKSLNTAAHEVWLDPSNRGKPSLFLSRRTLRQLRAVAGFPLNAQERLKCGGMMLRWTLWRSGDILRELRSAAWHQLAHVINK
jgi:glycosyltransferase involved in cell wall biosynthesis